MRLAQKFRPAPTFGQDVSLSRARANVPFFGRLIAAFRVLEGANHARFCDGAGVVRLAHERASVVVVVIGPFSITAMATSASVCPAHAKTPQIRRR